MVEKNKQTKNSLSAIAQHIAKLIDSVGGGSQHVFAKKVGCSQPLLSRIVNGRQEPGRELIARIEKLPEVDREELWACYKQRERDKVALLSYRIPIASMLLPGSVDDHPDFLTQETLAISPEHYSDTLYAVVATACRPAFDDQTEMMKREDKIVIETSVQHYAHNLAGLDAKLCVLKATIPSGDVLTLTRVRLKLDLKSSHQILAIAIDEPGNELDDGRHLRPIALDKPIGALDSQQGADPPTVELEFENIVGVAIQLVRSL